MSEDKKSEQADTTAEEHREISELSESAIRKGSNVAPNLSLGPDAEAPSAMPNLGLDTPTSADTEPAAPEPSDTE